MNRATYYQYVIPGKTQNRTVHLSEMTREELMVALMHSIDCIEKVGDSVSTAIAKLDRWQRVGKVT